MRAGLGFVGGFCHQALVVGLRVTAAWLGAEGTGVRHGEDMLIAVRAGFSVEAATARMADDVDVLAGRRRGIKARGA